MSNTKRTQLYHSELCTLCNGAWLQITVTSDVLRSKFNKPGEDKHYCEMTVAGVPRSYFVENPACGNALRGRKNQTLHIIASGSRDDAAIDVDPNAPPAAAAPPQQAPPAGNPPPPPTQRQPPPPAPAPTAAPAPAAAAPPANTRGGKQFVWDTLGQLSNLYLMCEMRVLEMPGFDDLTDPAVADCAEKRITTLFIQGVRMGLEQHLPMKLMQPKPKTTAPSQTQPPPPAPTPPPAASTQPPPPDDSDDVPF